MNNDSQQTVAEAIAAALQRHGVTEIFGQSIPAPVVQAGEDLGIRQVFYRTENAAGAMADAAARLRNRISVVAAQNGPAATLLVAPMAEALAASVPLLALVQDVPERDRDRNAFQELDHFALFSGVSKWTRRIETPERAIDYVDMAIAEATSGRPGPVVVLIPRDLMTLPAATLPHPRTHRLGHFPLDRMRAEREAIAEAATALAEAERPVVIAGGGVHLSGAVDAVVTLQELAAVPVATTNMGKGSVSELHELSLGVAGNIAGEYGPAHGALDLVTKADLILLIGTRTNENGTNGWTQYPSAARILQIDISPDEPGRTYEALRLVGDVRATVDELIAELRLRDLGKRHGQRAKIAARIAAGKRAFRERNRDRMSENDVTPLRPERMLAALDAQLTGDDIVVTDASYSSIWATGFLTAQQPGQRFIVPRGIAGLGWGLPYALGAKVAFPERRVIAIVGDGGFAHCWSEMETAIREDLPVTVILLNNSRLGFQANYDMFVWGRTSSAVEFADVDHVAVARACGANAIRVEHAEELDSALAVALAADRMTLIDLVIEPNAFPPVSAWDGAGDRVIAPVPAVRPGAGRA
ncbi:acetolactate synthase catalytic subunit [Leucobacter sp. 7(1)]|uniref:acetolactate synthase catalytic subunit n=1 Tax=Leucobacter sp. 7(1) TaxID=1255613 RepID=UPI000B3595A1|nr:acetolactate synthase catalytic subunit [Leucobacter sp. 7(1)]